MPIVRFPNRTLADLQSILNSTIVGMESIEVKEILMQIYAQA